MSQITIVIEQDDLIRFANNLKLIKRDMQPHIARMRESLDLTIDSLLDLIPPEALKVHVPPPAPAIRQRVDLQSQPGVAPLQIQAPPIVGSHISTGNDGAVAPGAVQAPGTSKHVDGGSSHIGVVEGGSGTSPEDAMAALKRVGLGGEITEPSVMGKAAKAQMEHPIAQPNQPAPAAPAQHQNIGQSDVVQTAPAAAAVEPPAGSHVEAGDVQPQGKDLPAGSHSNVGP